MKNFGIPFTVVTSRRSRNRKSCFLIYFILRLLVESTDDLPNLVLFEPAHDKFYCYSRTGLTRGSYDDFAGLLKNAWYLSDNDRGPYQVSAQTITTLLPLGSFTDFSKAIQLNNQSSLATDV